MVDGKAMGGFSGLSVCGASFVLGGGFDDLTGYQVLFESVGKSVWGFRGYPYVSLGSVIRLEFGISVGCPFQFTPWVLGFEQYEKVFRSCYGLELLYLGRVLFLVSFSTEWMSQAHPLVRCLERMVGNLLKECSLKSTGGER